MHAKSANAKGKRLESHLLDVFRREADATAHRNPGSGNGLDKADIRLPAHDMDIECKNTAKTNLWEDFEQMKRQAIGSNIGALIYRNPRYAEFKSCAVVLDLPDFLTLLRERGGESQVSFTADPSMKYDLQRLVEAAKKIIKHYETR